MMRVTSVLVSTLLSAQSAQLLDGLRQFRDGDLLGAESSFRKVLDTGDDPTARAFLALTEAGTGRCGKATGELAKQLADGSDPDVRRLSGLALVQCRIRTGNFDDAIVALARLQTLYPSDPDVLYQTSRLYMKIWNDTVREMFEKTPASFRVNQLSAEVFETESKYDAAVSEYRKALAKSPKTVGLHFRLGRAILAQSHAPEAMQEARAEFDAELALNPYDASAQYEVAQILLAEQQPEEAARRLERALKLSADFPEALIALARLRTGPETIQLLERAVLLAPRSEAAHAGLMLAYRNAGRLRESKAQKDELEKLLKPPEGEFSEFLKKLGEHNP